MIPERDELALCLSFSFYLVALMMSLTPPKKPASQYVFLLTHFRFRRHDYPYPIVRKGSNMLSEFYSVFKFWSRYDFLDGMPAYALDFWYGENYSQ